MHILSNMHPYCCCCQHVRIKHQQPWKFQGGYIKGNTFVRVPVYAYKNTKTPHTTSTDSSVTGSEQVLRIDESGQFIFQA